MAFAYSLPINYCHNTTQLDSIPQASEFDRRNSKKSAMVLISRWLLVLPPTDRQMLERCDLQLDNVAAIFHPPTTLRPPIKDIEKVP